MAAERPAVVVLIGNLRRNELLEWLRRRRILIMAAQSAYSNPDSRGGSVAYEVDDYRLGRHDALGTGHGESYG